MLLVLFASACHESAVPHAEAERPPKERAHAEGRAGGAERKEEVTATTSTTSTASSPGGALTFTAPADKTAVVVGVISGPAPSAQSTAPDLTDALHSIGVKTIRNNDYYDDRLDIEGILDCGGATYPSWTGCDPKSPSSYKWGPSDQLVESMKKGGFDLMLRVGGEWENQSRHHEFKGPQDAAMEDAWITAAVATAKRYHDRYAYLDIWTEWPGQHFWTRQNTDFGPFWAKAYKALKAAAPDKQVGGPGFAAIATRDAIEGRPGPVQEFFSSIASAGVRPDWIGWHTFTNDPHKVVEAGKAWRELVDGTGRYASSSWHDKFRGVPLVLDAVGSAKLDGDPPHRITDDEMREVDNGQRGAAFMAAMLIGLEATDTNLVYWYRAGDPFAEGSPPPGGRGPPAVGGDGLFSGDAAGTPKPRAWALRLWNTMATSYPTRTGVSMPAQDGLWALMAQNGSGKKAVLVANYTDQATTWSLKGDTLEGGTLWTVDSTQHGTTKASSTAKQAIPAWGVQLVELP